MEKNNIIFLLNGCDISIIAEAPEDITLKQLLRQCDKIIPEWCACGIKSLDETYLDKVEVKIDYDNLKKVDKNAPFSIKET